MIGAWITPEAYGMFRSGTTVAYARRDTLRSVAKSDGLFAYPVKNFGRFTVSVQMTCLLTALALRDAGISYASGRKLDIGMLATNLSGSTQENLAYFRDYIDGGRTLARANLFIYTLPSSPVAEAAVHFGLQGPLLYLHDPLSGMQTLEQSARRMLNDGQADRFLVIELTPKKGRCLVIQPTQDARCEN